MPVFDTPKPISVTLDIPAGNVRIAAADRADTVVEIRPTELGDTAAEDAAEAALVRFTDGELTISVPQPRRRGLRDLLRSGTVEVTIDLPIDSDVQGEVAGEVDGVGRLGECRLLTGWGDVRLDATGPLRVTTIGGQVSVDSAIGPVEISTEHGDILVRAVHGPATIKNVNGEIDVGEVSGDLLLTGVNGEIDVHRALGNVEARTAHGGVRIGEVVTGSVSLTTADGELDVGIAQDTAAWLDLDSASGEVHNMLDASAGPGARDRTVEVRARTSGGDIHIRRSPGR